MERFPDNGACLDYLQERFYPEGTECPKCGRPSKFHRISGRSAYSCQHCGHHVYPTAGTIFEKTTVNLQLWFYAIHLMASTRCGISAKQLEREIGVSNKTALRMFRQIRTLLSEDGEPPLSGDVEVDETFYGGKPKASQTRGMSGSQIKKMADAKKTIVLGMVERRGRVRTAVVPDRTAASLKGKVREYVLPESMIYTDELRLYAGIGKEYRGHRRVNHSQRIYVDGDASTNQIEGFFALLKTGIRGVYHSVSAKHLQSYCDEYSFRYNRRNSPEPMFWAMLGRVRKTNLAAS